MATHHHRHPLRFFVGLFMPSIQQYHRIIAISFGGRWNPPYLRDPHWIIAHAVIEDEDVSGWRRILTL